MKEKIANIINMLVMDYVDEKLSYFSRGVVNLLMIVPNIKKKAEILMHSKEILELLKEQSSFKFKRNDYVDH